MNILVYDPDLDADPQYRVQYEAFLREYPKIIRAWMEERQIPYQLGPRRGFVLVENAYLSGSRKDRLFKVREIIFKNPSDELRHGEDLITMLKRDHVIGPIENINISFIMYMDIIPYIAYLLDPDPDSI